MRVDNSDDRAEMPEECDICGSEVELKRFSHYGPGYQVDWLCKYCAVSTKEVIPSMAAMFNKLEKTLTPL